MIFLSAVLDNTKRTILEEIYVLYSKELWYIAKKIINDDQEAEDIVHSAFIKFCRYIDENTDIKCNKTKGLIRYRSKHIYSNITMVIGRQ